MKSAYVLRGFSGPQDFAASPCAVWENIGMASLRRVSQAEAGTMSSKYFVYQVVTRSHPNVDSPRTTAPRS
jgi:hypothetical protein